MQPTLYEVAQGRRRVRRPGAAQISPGRRSKDLPHARARWSACCAKAASNKAIAKKLPLAELTVRRHLSAIFAKLGVASRMALVVFAYQRSLASLPD
jgi:hypothetical protein